MSQDQHSQGERRKGDAVWAAELAVTELAGLIDRPIDHVASIAKEDDSWLVGIEVVETERVPESADVLAIYTVEINSDGELTGYSRGRRYLRGRADD